MLAEAAIYLLSARATPPAFRPCLVEAVGLWARGRRQAHAWGPHLARTRATIEAAMPARGSRRTVAVLGAGPLFDMPVEALSRSFARVILFDVAHLHPARRRTARLGNVEHAWRDLSPPGEPAPLAFLMGIPGLDWVISANLLSQLADAAPAGEERVTIERHLAGLAALPAPVTLITDTAYIRVDRSGAPIERHDLLHGRPMPQASASWEWEVAPFGEEAADLRRTHAVAAYPDWHAAQP
jgi:hypothetical protein